MLTALDAQHYCGFLIKQDCHSVLTTILNLSLCTLQVEEVRLALLNSISAMKHLAKLLQPGGDWMCLVAASALGNLAACRSDSTEVRLQVCLQVCPHRRVSQASHRVRCLASRAIDSPSVSLLLQGQRAHFWTIFRSHARVSGPRAAICMTPEVVISAAALLSSSRAEVSHWYHPLPLVPAPQPKYTLQ